MLYCIHTKHAQTRSAYVMVGQSFSIECILEVCCIHRRINRFSYLAKSESCQRDCQIVQLSLYDDDLHKSFVSVYYLSLVYCLAELGSLIVSTFPRRALQVSKCPCVELAVDVRLFSATLLEG